MTIPNEQSIEVLDPIAPATALETRLSRRPDSLRGKTVALIDENQPNARYILEGVARRLREAAGVRKILYRNFKTGFGYDLEGGVETAPSARTLAEIAAGCDAAVVGVAH